MFLTATTCNFFCNTEDINSLTICTIIAQRVAKGAKVDYQQAIADLIGKTLERLASI